MMGEHCWRYLTCIHAESVDLTTQEIMILSCDYALDIIVFFVGGLFNIYIYIHISQHILLVLFFRINT